MPTRSVQHETFVIERSYNYPRERVYAAWADQGAKTRWFVGPDNWEKSNHKLDFRVGGKESVSGGHPGGPVHYYNATYQDIVPNERIVSTYDMLMDDKRISVSVATVEFRPSGNGTMLVLTEQGVFLDGWDNAGQREHGTRELLNNLDAYLAQQAAH